MQAQQPIIRACHDCDSTARYLVLVPFFCFETKATGADWTPLCRAHLPTAESWKTVSMRDATPATVLALSLESLAN
tara:strand:+ start:1645 stop:1872 length:228 start_codon:yes stop_codon:yes gene_type:complete